MTYTQPTKDLSSRMPHGPSRGLPFIFFAAGTISVTLGMCWGIEMGIRNDFTMAPAHAHLNLVGWVTMALFALYYHITPVAVATTLARVHCVLAILGLVLLVPGIAIADTGGTPAPAIAGALVTLLSMLIFLFTVMRFGLGQQA